jgi:hypothetical protein
MKIGDTLKDIIDSGYNPCFDGDRVLIIACPTQGLYNDEGQGPRNSDKLERITEKKLFFSGGGWLIGERY